MRKGYFFTTDAIVGVSVLVLGIMLVLFNFVSQPVEVPQYIIADDLLRVLSTAEVEPEITYFQKLGEFASRCSFEEAKSLTQSFLPDNIVPSQFNAKIIIRSTCTKNGMIPFQEPIVTVSHRPITEADAEVLVTARKILFDSTIRNGYFPPVIIEARVWR